MELELLDTLATEAWDRYYETGELADLREACDAGSKFLKAQEKQWHTSSTSLLDPEKSTATS